MAYFLVCFSPIVSLFNTLQAILCVFFDIESSAIQSGRCLPSPAVTPFTRINHFSSWLRVLLMPSIFLMFMLPGEDSTEPPFARITDLVSFFLIIRMRFNLRSEVLPARLPTQFSLPLFVWAHLSLYDVLSGCHLCKFQIVPLKPFGVYAFRTPQATPVPCDAGLPDLEIAVAPW